MQTTAYSLDHNTVRDISYSGSAETRPGRAMIRFMENTSGRLGLIKRARDYGHDIAAGRDFWEVMVERFGLSLDIYKGSLDLIPRDGPLVMVANHPYGILDGLVMGYLASKTRGDFRILAHSVFKKAPELERVLLPVNFDGTREAMALNIDTRKRALQFLAEGGTICIFPAGTVSTAIKPFAHPMDTTWRRFTARMISKSRAQVQPVFFDGHNSRLFQVASHLHYTLRMGLLVKEFKRRTDRPVRLGIGAPLSRAELDPFANDPREMMDFLRKSTYALSSKPLDPMASGFEFEDHYR